MPGKPSEGQEGRQQRQLTAAPAASSVLAPQWSQVDSHDYLTRSQLPRQGIRVFSRQAGRSSSVQEQERLPGMCGKGQQV